MTKLIESLKAGATNVKEKITSGLKKRDNVYVIIAVFAAVAVMLAVTVAFLLKPADYTDPDQGLVVQAEDGEVLRHPLTGMPIDEALTALPQVFGVMVENSADAWPLSGIEDAFLVIEAPVEGSIPRFISFFSSEQEVAKIGPVRSARPYYLDWNDEFNGLYAHVGGSPEGLDLIAEYGTSDLNEFYQGEYFWRDNVSRYAPHNTYTSTELLNKSLLELDLDAPNYQSWLFKDDAPLDIDPLSLVIDWGQGSTYDVTWTYQPDDNAYLRHQASAKVSSLDGDQILAKNIVVMASDITVVDSTGRRHIRTIGEGDALIVQDGKIILGTWEKPTRTDRLRFYDSSGTEVRMNAGQSWIEVVPSLDHASTVSAAN